MSDCHGCLQQRNKGAGSNSSNLQFIKLKITKIIKYSDVTEISKSRTELPPHKDQIETKTNRKHDQ